MILDASAAVEWLLGRPLGSAVAERLADEDVAVQAPHLLVVEVAHVLRRVVRSGDMPPQRGGLALAALSDLDVAYHDHLPLVAAVWRWRDRMTAYDATYVALAAALGEPLVTLDARLARAIQSLVEVDLVTGDPPP